MNINATLIAQALVFAFLVWFTKEFVWPPMQKALDERAQKIADGLASAEKAKSELAQANARVEQELAQSKDATATRIADAERRAQVMLEEAKAKASEEAAKIIAAARAEAQAEVHKVRDQLRDDVAALAVRGAEQILRREVNPQVHAELLGQLRAQL